MQKLQAIQLSDDMQRKQALQSALSQASNTYGNMMKEQSSTTKTQATVGGAAMSALGGAAAGAMVGTQLGGPGWGTAAGSVIGLAGYYL